MIHIHTQTHTHAHARTHIYTHSLSSPFAHAHTHIHTLFYIYQEIFSPFSLSIFYLTTMNPAQANKIDISVRLFFIHINHVLIAFVEIKRRRKKVISHVWQTS